jgi:hypothetical protein
MAFFRFNEGLLDKWTPVKSITRPIFFDYNPLYTVYLKKLQNTFTFVCYFRLISLLSQCVKGTPDLLCTSIVL